MTDTHQGKLGPKLVGITGDEQKNGSPLTRQVPFDDLMCHGSESNRDSYHDSESSCDSLADLVENLSLYVKPGKSVMSMLPVVDIQLSKIELSYFDGKPRGYLKFLREFETYV